MDLTDDELDELCSFLENETLYGDSEIVYTEKGDLIRSVYGKARDEAKRRGFAWAR